MNHAHQLLYKSFKATVCTGAVALATSVSAQTPWQAAPAIPAPLIANPTATSGQSGNPATFGQPAAKQNSTADQKQVINRYAVGSPQQPQSAQPATIQPGLAAPGINNPFPPNASALTYPGQQFSGQQFPGQPANQQPGFAQPQLQYSPASSAPQVNNAVGSRPLNPQLQAPQPYQVQYQQAQGQPVQPPAMVPFNPMAQTTGPVASGGGYRAVDLPPPGAQPTTQPVPSSPSGRADNQRLAQSLLDAIQGAPSVQNSSTNSNLTSPPPLSSQQPVAPQQLALPNSSMQKQPSRDLPGAGQLLPKNAPTPTQNGNTARPGDRGSIAQANTDPDSFQGRIPTLDDLPIPDITVFEGSKNLLVSSSKDVDTGPVTSEPWNTKLVAIVGNERVLAGDMAAVIEPIIVQNRAQLRSKKQENEARLILVRQLLPEYISMKALQQQFFRDIAGNVPPKELQKKKDEIMSKASKAFYDKYVPIELYRKYKVDDLAELEGKLQENGLGINIMKNHFLMQVLAMQCEDKYVADSFEIPPGDILDYYEKNIDKWRIPARVKWRELVTRFDKHPSKDAARNAINNLGNEVFLTGKPFEAVARDSSEGHNAKEGGTYDWTTAGSLKSEVIEQALFNLPLRRLSEVIEDDMGYHIVEVLEREPARIQDMAEIQTEIRKKLSNEIRAEKLKEFRNKILIRTPIWTTWPDDIPGSKPLVDVQESE